MNRISIAIKKAGALMGLLLLTLGASAQQIELNDPQIISIAETVFKIDRNYVLIAQKRSRNKDVRQFAQTLADNNTRLFNQTIELEKKLILATQTNFITVFLMEQEKWVTDRLNTKKPAYFDQAYVDNEVSFHEAAVYVVKYFLIPQARNVHLKNYLNEIYPLLEQDLAAAKKMQAELNR